MAGKLTFSIELFPRRERAGIAPFVETVCRLNTLGPAFLLRDIWGGRHFLFNGGINTVQEGPAIAWVWGKDVFVGTNVISAGIINEQIGPKPAEPAVDGVTATFGGSAKGDFVPA